jgi:hypothetical protein
MNNFLVYILLLLFAIFLLFLRLFSYNYKSTRFAKHVWIGKFRFSTAAFLYIFFEPFNNLFFSL